MTSKNLFICESCREQFETYDALTVHEYAVHKSVTLIPKDVVQRAKESMTSGGPPTPWEVAGNTSIRAADGQEMIFESYWDGKPHGGINSWTRQRICDSINLLPELIAEIERLIEERNKWSRLAAERRALLESYVARGIEVTIPV